MKITIQNKSYELKYKLKNFFVFEAISGYSYTPGKLIDEYLLFYSTLLANNEEFTLEFEEFLESCESDPSLLASYNSFLVEALKLQNQVYNEKNIKKKKAKTVTQV